MQNLTSNSMSKITFSQDLTRICNQYLKLSCVYRNDIMNVCPSDCATTDNHLKQFLAATWQIRSCSRPNFLMSNDNEQFCIGKSFCHNE